jgi:predicted RND superfamily exporter protein
VAIEEKALTRKQFGGSWVGAIAYWIFHLRKPLLWLFVLVTLGLGYSATRLEVQAGFTKMIPLEHEYMRTFVDYQKDFGGANKILVALRSKDGDIYSAEFLDKLKQLHDDLFYLRGVDRASVLSLYSSSAIFIEVVEDGFKAGPVLPNNFDGRPQSVTEFRDNLLKSSWVGRIVANDFKSAMVAVVLQDNDQETGKRLDVKQVGADLEKIRAKYENDKYSVHVVGFAKSASDIAAGAQGVLLFFAAAFLITAALLFWYSGSLKLTFWALIVAMVPVIWLLGLLPILGLALDPMSILVPFLIFSIGVSHAVQMTNAWKLDVLSGADGVTAARSSFMNLFVPGVSALIANAVGFMVIAFVKIEMVQELAITATLGVSLMIFTNKLLLPILLSFMKLSARDAKKIKGKESSGDWLWTRISAVATPRTGAVVVVAAVLLLGSGVWKAKQLHIGDLGQGVPELRESARYNRDVEVVSKSFAVGVDVLNVIAEAKAPAACVDLEALEMIDRFEFFMRQTDGVQSVRGMAGFVRGATAGYSEGDLKWAVIPDNKPQRAQAAGLSTRGGVSDLANRECSAMNVSLFTRDHQAPTIAHIVEEVKKFKGALDSDHLTFRLASGNVGVMAATNEAVEAADKWVNLALFASVGLLCLITFRSVMVTLCIILPLGLSVVLCNALMATLGIGLKVNTLPVVALGVGVGVDYGIYLFEVMRHEMKERKLTLRQGFLEALKQRGTASLFTAVTMTIGVATWVLSTLKFQADMGVLLGFMFMVNLLGAILVAPALAAFLIRDKTAAPKPRGRLAAKPA